MAYSALEKMNEINLERFGRELGPAQPELHCNGDRLDLKSAALRFLHNRCEALLFNDEVEKEENESGIFHGKSLKANQIPYNMERDIDRLCLERSMEAFIESGTADDAYTVYYCYLVMFFGRYGKSKRMIELLSEYESNGSSLLLKHRDHFSHSVYVFALGLAIYDTNEHYRHEFNKFYGLDYEGDDSKAEHKAANFFLEYWGLTALFHDIGYPFELPFEQVLSYFEADDTRKNDSKKRGEGCIYFSYQSIENLSRLSEKEQSHFKKLYGRDFPSTDDLFAYDITEKLGFAYDLDESNLKNIISNKPSHPEQFNYYMDHAYFSAVRLYRELSNCFLDSIQRVHIDCLTSILLHNSFFKHSILFYNDEDKSKRKAPLCMKNHPLAYLLMLCDELQCWDRTAYGRNTRTELYPMDATFDFSNNSVSVKYLYDSDEKEKIDAYEAQYKAWEDGGKVSEAPRLKAYSDMAEKQQRFVEGIRKIVDLERISLSITVAQRSRNVSAKHIYLSQCNFLHLYDLAVILSGRRIPDASPEEIERKFESRSLEYQISHVNRAKSFSRYLNEIHCFFTDRPVAFNPVMEFSKDQTEEIAPLEHERWVLEHQAMGWRYGTDYEELAGEYPQYKADDLREQMRQHKLTMNAPTSSDEIRAHFAGLGENDQDKDKEPMNKMLRLLKKYDGLRIYRLNF